MPERTARSRIRSGGGKTSRGRSSHAARSRHTFEDDPLRILPRHPVAAQLEFRIEERTFKAVSAMRERLSIVSPERITGEFLKIMRVRQPSIGLRMMFETGVLQIVFPK